MSELPTLHAKCIELVELLVIVKLLSFTFAHISLCSTLNHANSLSIIFKVEGNKLHYGKVVKVLQDIFEVVTHDMMTDSSRFDALKIYSFFYQFKLLDLSKFIFKLHTEY